MGGKTGTTTQSVQIPPQVLARYNAVNARAEQVAKTPFQPYTGQFVAGLTPTQQAGVSATNQAAQTAQPYFSAATQQLGQAQGQGQQALQAAFGALGQGVGTGQGYAQAATQGIGAALQGAQPYQQAATEAALYGAQGIQPGALQTQQYMNPFTQAVAQTTQQALQQQQQEQMAGQLGNAIRSGAFGGDRAGLAAANLARQQQLGMAQAMAPIYQQGYSQALQTAQQQQGVELSAAQANRAALQNLSQQLQGLGQQGYGQQIGAAQQMAALGQQQFGQGLGAAQQLGALGQQQYGMGAGTAQQLAALGTGAQQAALQGAQAQIGAGTLEQQTQQADLTARYQQFLQERGYPFQVAQFLANIAMGTGALSGSTTTTTQPMPFFSDRRVKDDVKEIGKTHDGQPIYSFKYKGDDATRIGLMAQDVEKKHPEAVYDMGGVKGVDYKQATEDSERPERYEGGLVPASMGGAVTQPGAYARGGYAIGGDVIDPNDLQAILAQQQQAFGPFGEGGIYGMSHHQTPFSGAKGIVPETRLHTPKLMTPGPAPRLPESGASQAVSAFDTAMGMKDRYEKAKELIRGKETPQQSEDQSRVGQTGTDRSKLAGPDIVPDKKPEEEKSLIRQFGDWTGWYADGGVVPREHYAIGGSKDPSLPYEEDDKSPGKYFPTEILETEKPELAKPSSAPSSTSQTGLSLGTILGFFLKDGGVVPRHGYATDGSVEEEQNPDEYALNAAKEILRRREGFLEKPKYDVNALRAGYGTDQYTTPEGKVVPVTAETRFTREDAERDLSRRAPMFMQKAQTDIGRDAWAKLTPDARAALTSVTYNYGSVPKSVVQAAQSGDTAAVADAVYNLRHANEGINAGRRAYEASFINPQGSYEADLPARGAKTAQGVKPQQESQGLMPGVQNWLAENQGWLSPTGAFLKGMAQSKSPFLGGALLEGVGAGLEAVTPSQKALADIAQTRAATGLTQMQALREGLIPTQFGNFIYARNRQTGEVELLTAMDYNRKKANYEMVTDLKQQPSQEQQMQAIQREQQSGGTPVPPVTGAPTSGVPEKAAGDESLITVAPPGTRYDAKSKAAAQAAPQIVSDAQMGGGPQALIPVEQGEKYIKDVSGAANAARGNQLFVTEFAKNLAKASTLKGFEAPGFAFNPRAEVVNMLDTTLRAFGAGGVGDANDIKAIQSKVESLRGTLMASQAGQESYHALKMLADANANPNMSPDAYAPLVAMMMVQERRNIDRANHAQQWGADSGQVYYGADQDFERQYNTAEMMRQAHAIEDLVKNAPNTFQKLLSGKHSRDEINATMKKLYGVDNMARYFIGEAG